MSYRIINGLIVTIAGVAVATIMFLLFAFGLPAALLSMAFIAADWAGELPSPVVGPGYVGTRLEDVVSEATSFTHYVFLPGGAVVAAIMGVRVARSVALNHPLKRHTFYFSTDPSDSKAARRAHKD